jgi:hypothetical protein
MRQRTAPAVNTDGIARKARQRRDSVRHASASDRAKRKEVVERQRDVAHANRAAGQHDHAQRRRSDRVEDLAEIDIAQNEKQRDARCHDDQQTEGKADPVPAAALENRPGKEARHIWHRHPVMSFRISLQHLGQPLTTP